MYKTIKVELTYGCNLRCSFCGIQSHAPEPIQFMSLDTLDKILNRLAGDKRKNKLSVSFSLRGEPTLHPEYLKAVTKTSFVAVNTMMISNGTRLDEHKILALFVHGLDALHIDVYTESVATMIRKLRPTQLFDVKAYGAAASVWKFKSTERGLVSICDERETRNNNTRWLHNWAGANNVYVKPYEFIPRQSPCAEPLKMITIRHDGTYALCCQSWNDVKTFGNVEDHSFEDIYYSKEYQAICRQIMRPGGRNGLDSCGQCNVKSVYAHMFRKALNEK